MAAPLDEGVEDDDEEPFVEVVVEELLSLLEEVEVVVDSVVAVEEEPDLVLFPRLSVL